MHAANACPRSMTNSVRQHVSAAWATRRRQRPDAPGACVTGRPSRRLSSAAEPDPHQRPQSNCLTIHRACEIPLPVCGPCRQE
jgi:hypothetical protein